MSGTKWFITTVAIGRKCGDFGKQDLFISKKVLNVSA